MAIGFSAIAAVVLLTHPGVDGVVRAWGLVTGFYLAAGALGGALWGFLRPVQHTYWGKCLTAYLLLVLIYGGGTVALGPLLGPRTLPLWIYIAAWAVISVVLAPIAVAVFRGTSLPDRG